MRGECRRAALALVGRPGRLAHQQAGAVDGGGGIGEPVGEGLERPDRYAELVALLRVLDAELERGAGEAHQCAGGEHPPLVDGVLVELAGSGTVRDDGARALPERAVGNRAVPEVVRRTERRPVGLDRHQLVVVEPDHDGPDRPCRHEAREPVARGLQREGRDGRALGVHTVERRRGPGRRRPRGGEPRPARRRAGWARGPRRIARRRAPGRAARPRRHRRPDRRPSPGRPSAPNASQSAASNPSVSSDARTTAGGHSLRKKVPTASTSCSCSSVSERSTAYGALGVGALGVGARREGGGDAGPPAHHRPVGILLHPVERDLVVGHALEHRRDRLREHDPRQVRSGAPVDADAERHVTVRVPVDHELVGVRELRVVASGGHFAQQHGLPLLHLDPTELGVGGDDPLVGTRRRIEAEELLGGHGQQVGLVDQSSPIGGVLREVQQRSAGERRGGVDAADRREERDRLRDVLGQPFAVDLVVRDRGRVRRRVASRSGPAALRRSGSAPGRTPRTPSGARASRPGTRRRRGTRRRTSASPRAGNRATPA